MLDCVTADIQQPEPLVETCKAQSELRGSGGTNDLGICMRCKTARLLTFRGTLNSRRGIFSPGRAHSLRQKGQSRAPTYRTWRTRCRSALTGSPALRSRTDISSCSPSAFV